MKTILFFTAGMTATAGELAAIAKLNTLAGAPYQVKVLNGAVSAAYGAGNVVGDYVAGTVPDAYLDEEDAPIYPVFDPDAPPAAPTLPASQAVVSDGDTLEVASTEVTFDVTAGVLSGTIAATKTVVSDGDVINITGGGSVAITVAGGAITGAVYTAPG